jgi:hypothetical protein
MLENVLSNRENIHDMHDTEKKTCKILYKIRCEENMCNMQAYTEYADKYANNVYINMYNIHHMKKNMQKKKQIYQGLCKVC